MKRVIALCCLLVALTGCDLPRNGSPGSTTSAIGQGSSGGLPADLSPAAATHLEVTGSERGTIAGKDGYRLTLSTGEAWAVKGTPEEVVPALRADPVYNAETSVFWKSGAYVVFARDAFRGLPEKVATFVGKRPDLEAIDSDCIPPVPDPQLC
ncbi:hypothetical protein D5S17_13435 [Pseudonocardiaceae bacterium YIM PH 21723]|nr:hypothetical protein D5S17_13435 [Pseudonocardiaceae bacterium YIM PH 21723]